MFGKFGIEIVNVKEEELPICAKILRDIYNNNVLSEGWTEESSLNICKFFYKLQPDLFFVAKTSSGGGLLGSHFLTSNLGRMEII